MIEPQVFVGEDAITILFGVIPNRHTIYIDVEKDQLFFDGERKKTTDIKFYHNKAYMFEKNKGFEKKTILVCPKEEEIKYSNYPIVLMVDIGFDGRLFFKFFTRLQYSKFRGPPFRTMSYWHSRGEHMKKFYDGDLHEPKKVWSVKYKNEVLA